MGIPESVAVTSADGQLPQRVAELPPGSEAPEAEPYVISFAKYKEKMCEISYLDSNKARKALDVLKKIGTKISSQVDFQRNNIDRIPVANQGDYRRLYNQLGPDMEVKEIKLQQNARIFYFDIESEKKLYIVAITQNHLETDKVRR